MTELRWARPDERRKIQDYLFRNMGKISHKQWFNILDGRWNSTNDHYGVVVEEGGELVGFLGIVFADRLLAGKPHRTGNITSWFLEKHLRRGGLGQAMLDLITSEENVTYTALSANFRSGALLKKIGWKLLEDTRLFWNRTAKPSVKSIHIDSGFSLLEGRGYQQAKRILTDHAGLNLTPHLLTAAPDEQLFFVTYMKKKGPDDTNHLEILHSSDSRLLTKYISEIANCLLPETNSVLSSDKRFLAPTAEPDDSQSLQIARYFKPANKQPGVQIDFLYSEVVLLDLKIY